MTVRLRLALLPAVLAVLLTPLTLALTAALVFGAPNRDCTPAEHAAYHATGPDGLEYAIWHPQVQPDVWCYFRHEHGSDPSAVHPNLKPLFGYAAARAGVGEFHEGFKVHAFSDIQNHGWAITLHQGSSSVGRACVRFHELDYLVVDLSSGDVLANLASMGDFGRAESNSATHDPIVPSACPTQYFDAMNAGSTGVRQLPVKSQGGVLYEPWRVDQHSNALGVVYGDTTINVPTPITICPDLWCNFAHNTWQAAAGAFRFFSMPNQLALVAGTGHSGTFWTDPYGKQTLSSGAPGATQQYLKPGANLDPFTVAVTCYPFGQWRMTYRCDGQPLSSNMNLDGRLRSPN